MIFDQETLKKLTDEFVFTAKHCDHQSRKEFAYIAFEILKRKLNISAPLTLQFIDSSKYQHGGELMFGSIKQTIKITDKYIQGDKTYENDGIVDMFTMISESDNSWKMPTLILKVLLHELQHYCDYAKDALFILDKDKIAQLDEQTVQDLYTVTPSELRAGKFAYDSLEKILLDIADCCANDTDRISYSVMSEKIRDSILPQLAIWRENHTKKYNSAKARLKRRGFKVEDFIKSIQVNHSIKINSAK